MELAFERAIEEPYSFLEKALLAGPTEWLPKLAADAGDRLVSELGFGLAGASIARPIQVDVTPATVYPGRCVICLSWKGAVTPVLYPELAGVLELVAVGSERSRLSFEASYEPPARAFGRLVDRALMRRVAHASVSEFVDRVADALARGARSRRQQS